MGDLTEKEIFDCLETNLRECAGYCVRMARGDRGDIYVRFRRKMKLIEGACRQAAMWRGDSRWLPFGIKIHEAQERVGKWLREHPFEPRKLVALAALLEQSYHGAIKLKEARTNRTGLILPMPGRGPQREGRPVQVILPPGYDPSTRH